MKVHTFFMGSIFLAIVIAGNISSFVIEINIHHSNPEGFLWIAPIDSELEPQDEPHIPEPNYPILHYRPVNSVGTTAVPYSGESFFKLG